jgi:hypothetical protein
MDIDDFAEFTVLNLLGERKISEFIKAQDCYLNKNYIFKLLMMHYLISSKGSCWTQDIIDGIAYRKGQKTRVEAALYMMTQSRVVIKREQGRGLGHRWDITNKGMYIIRQYAAWTRDQQREYHYKIKESHRILRELKEK